MSRARKYFGHSSQPLYSFRRADNIGQTNTKLFIHHNHFPFSNGPPLNQYLQWFSGKLFKLQNRTLPNLEDFVDHQTNLAQFNRMIMRSQEVRRCGSAALDLCSVAAGRLDGYWELKLKPWDVAAGSLIVLEAGGMVTALSGAPYSIRDNSIVASNGLIHGQMLDELAKVSQDDQSC